MGNRSKDEATTGVPDVKGREVLNDADFSMLMVNFRSAKLSSPPVLVASEEKANVSDQCEDDIVTPLQNFHLRPPAHSKSTTRRRRKKGKESNELNLSVAAGSIQRPMVWPARLKAAAAVSRSLLHPARLSALPSLTKSSEEGLNSSGVEKALNKKVVELLQKNTSLDLKTYLTLSHELSAGSEGSSRLFGAGQSADSTGEQAPTFDSLNKCSSNKKQKAALTSSVIPLSQQFPRSSSRLFSKFCSSGRDESQNNCCQNTLSPPVSTPVPSSDDQPLVRSCSSEMRLVEETNVNELASYLDDLLHIPRKMSSMAEMMYA